MNGPAVASAPLLGLVRKLYRSNMPQMLNKHLVILRSRSRGVRQNQANERKALLSVRVRQRKPTDVIYLMILINKEQAVHLSYE